MVNQHRTSPNALGNQLIEYSLPLAIFLTAGLVLSFTTNVPQAVTTFFRNSQNALFSGDGLLVASLGSGVQGTNTGIDTTSDPDCLQNGCISDNSGGNIDTTAPNGGNIANVIEEQVDQLPEGNSFTDLLAELAAQAGTIADMADYAVNTYNPNQDPVAIFNPDTQNLNDLLDLFNGIYTQSGVFNAMLQAFIGIPGLDLNAFLTTYNLSSFNNLSEFMAYLRTNYPGLNLNFVQEALVEQFYYSEEAWEMFVQSVEFFQNNPAGAAILQTVDESGNAILQEAYQYSVYQTTYDPSTGVLTILNLITGRSESISGSNQIGDGISATTIQTRFDMLTDIQTQGDIGAGPGLSAVGFKTTADGGYVQITISTGSNEIISFNADLICQMSPECSGG